MKRASAVKAAAVGLAAAALLGAGPASGVWVLQKIPSAGRTSFAKSVSCPTATACFAVGNSATPPGPGLGLAEQWDGSTWTDQIIPDNDSEAVVAVSCSGVSACTAVGNVGLPPLVDRWNGSQWNSQQAKFPAGAFGASFWAVSCPAANACEATGNWQKTGFNGPEMLLAERWNGSTWTIQATPDPSGTKPVLDGVSCPAVNTCVAVGNDTVSGSQRTLAEKWNGTSWTILPTVNLGGGAGNGQLDAVSCASATACTAVGSYHANSTELTLAEVWNGSKWTVQPTPNPSGATGSGLEAVSCPTATTCTATGQTVITGAGGTLAEAVVAGAWVLQPTPSPTKTSFLAGVSCVSTICIAVGGDDSNFTLGTVPVAMERG